MHIAYPLYFHKLYLFPPYFRKIYLCSHISTKFIYFPSVSAKFVNSLLFSFNLCCFGLIYVLLPPILAMMHLRIMLYTYWTHLEPKCIRHAFASVDTNGSLHELLSMDFIRFKSDKFRIIPVRCCHSSSYISLYLNFFHFHCSVFKSIYNKDNNYAVLYKNLFTSTIYIETCIYVFEYIEIKY